MNRENLRTIVIFTSLFDPIVKKENMKELNELIYYLYEYQINIIVFGYQVGTQHKRIWAEE